MLAKKQYPCQRSNEKSCFGLCKGASWTKGQFSLWVLPKEEIFAKRKKSKSSLAVDLTCFEKCWKQVTVTYFFRLKNKEQLLGSLFGPCQSPLLCWYFLYVVQLGRIFKGEMGEINLSAGSTLTFKGKVRSKRLHIENKTQSIRESDISSATNK